MIFAIPKKLILLQLKRQLKSHFLISSEQIAILDKYFDRIIDKCSYCFSQTTNKYYQKEEQPYFSPYISTQYLIFLYYFSNTIYKEEPNQRELCDKLYYLNKIFNSVDIFYAVELPDFFMCEHPVGTVMGRGTYGQGFMFYQNCVVGGFLKPDTTIIYPNIGLNVKMFAGTMIIGDCTIGDNVNIGAGALIKNQNIPNNSNVFGSSPNLIIKPIKEFPL
jgi:serine O-acetyltransferase